MNGVSKNIWGSVTQLFHVTIYKSDTQLYLEVQTDTFVYNNELCLLDRGHVVHIRKWKYSCLSICALF